MRNKMVNIFSVLCLILERARHFVKKNKRRVFKCLNTRYSLRGVVRSKTSAIGMSD